jgi:hypothetical protein
VETVRRAAEAALAKLDFTIRKDTSAEIEGTKRGIGSLIGTGAEHVVLRMQAFLQDGRAGTLVTAGTSSGLAGRLTQKSWTNAVLAQIGCQPGLR